MATTVVWRLANQTYNKSPFSILEGVNYTMYAGYRYYKPGTNESGRAAMMNDS